jgi:hypothetical protein
MAQDWHEQFPSGKDPLAIDTMDLDGSTMAALQGLAVRQKADNDELKLEVQEMKDRLAALEAKM